MIELKVGDKIQDYTLVEFISSGTTAVVWRVKDSLGQDKAIKIFSPERGLDTSTTDLLFDEFKLTITFRHDNILHTEKMGRHGNIPYIVMPYCRESLASEMNRRLLHRKKYGETLINVFSEKEIWEAIEDICSGLAYLHDNNIIHQDVKPENILLMHEGQSIRYVLTDFGISSRLRKNILRQTKPLQTNNYMYTPAYAAPEQLKGYVGIESDMFAIGVIAYEMLEGRLPFDGGKPTAEYIHEGLRIRPFASSVSDTMQRFVQDCLYQPIENRPTAQQAVSLAGEMIEALNRSVHEAQREIRRTESLPSRDDFSHTSRNLEHVTHPIGRQYEKTMVSGPGSHPMPEVPPSVNQGNRSAEIPRRSKKGKLPVAIRAVFIIGVVLMVALLSLIVFRSFSSKGSHDIITKARLHFEQGHVREANTNLKKMKVLPQEAFGLMTTTERILERGYQYIGPFHRDRAIVKSAIGWGAIDIDGNEILPCQYDEISEFSSEYTVVRKGNYCGLVSGYGQEVTPVNFSFCWEQSPGVWLLRLTDSRGRKKQEFRFSNGKLE